MSGSEFKTESKVKTATKYSGERTVQTGSYIATGSFSSSQKQDILNNLDSFSVKELKLIAKSLKIKTTANSKDGLKRVIRNHLQKQGYKSIDQYKIIDPYKKGKIDQKELDHLGYAENDKLVNFAPVEAIAGVNAKKSEQMRKQDIKVVQDVNELLPDEKEANAIRQDLKQIPVQTNLDITKPSEPIRTEPSEPIRTEPKVARSGEGFDQLDVNYNNINYDMAYNAYRNISWTPDERAKEVQREYVNEMRQTYNELEPLAKNERQKEVLHEEMIRYKETYIRKEHDLLASRSRLASSAITGGSNFPVRQQQKRRDIEHKKTGEFIEWKKKAKRSMRRKIEAEKSAEEISQESERVLIRDLDQARSNTDYVKINAKSRLKSRIETLAYNGDKEGVNQQLTAIKNYQQEHNVVIFREDNEIWKLNEVAEKRSQKLDIQATAEPETIASFHGATIVDNQADERVQILFDKIPDVEVRNDLKERGWRWSPKNQAWQRKNTYQAKQNAIQIVSKHYQKDTSGPDTKIEFEPEPKTIVSGKTLINDTRQRKETANVSDVNFELKHEIMYLEEQREESQKVNESLKQALTKVQSKKSWSKTELKQYLLSNGIYAPDFESATGKENWIKEAENAIEGHIDSNEKQLKSIDELMFYRNKDRLDEKFKFVNVYEIENDRLAERRLANENRKIQLSQETLTRIESAQSKEELKEIQENFRKERKEIEAEQKIIDKRDMEETQQFYREVRDLPVEVGNTVGNYDRDKSYERNTPLTELRNTPEWKQHVTNETTLVEYHIKPREEELEKAKQEKRVEEVKQVLATVKTDKKYKMEEDIIGYAGEREYTTKTGNIKRVDESWFILPDGRFIKIRNGVITNQGSKDYNKAIEELDIQRVFKKGDLTNKERYILMYAYAHGDGSLAFENYREEMEEKTGDQGMLMDRAHTTAMIDITEQRRATFPSEESEATIGDLELITKEDNYGKKYKYYKINNTFFSKSYIDSMERYSAKDEKQFKNTVIFHEEGKAIFIATDQKDLWLVVAPSRAEEEEEEDEEDYLEHENDEFEEWDDESEEW